ncbi:MAG: hypothetical protein KGZ30_04615 [Anaplasmataceae bacterium]|nr:hypothetical protein [Anaplasmataceae bacterium]
MVGSFLSGYRQIFVTLFFTLLVLPLVIPKTSWAAFGASPPFLNASHLVKGAKYEQIIYLVRDNAEEDLPIKVNLSLPDTIKSWITMEQGTEFIIPKGVRQFPVKILIQVPQNAGLGVYSGSMTFGSQPKEAGQVTISLGIEIPINLTVGTDIYREVKVGLIKLLDIEEGWSPRVYVKLENGGNVLEKFDSATYELFDAFKDKRYAISQKREGFPEVAPFSTEEFTIDFPVDFHLGVGQYWGSVTFYQGDTPVGGQTTLFNVLKRGSLSNPAGQFLSFLKIETYGLYYLLGLLTLAGFGFIWKKRSKKNRGS